MLDISNNGFISLTRGDSFSVPLFINRGTVFHPVRYYISDNPKASVYLGVMEPNQPFERATIRKKYTSESSINDCGDLMIEFTSNDTKYLYPGRYYYEVRIKHSDGSVETVIPATDFVIFEQNTSKKYKQGGTIV